MHRACVCTGPAAFRVCVRQHTINSGSLPIEGGNLVIVEFLPRAELADLPTWERVNACLLPSCVHINSQWFAQKIGALSCQRVAASRLAYLACRTSAAAQALLYSLALAALHLRIRRTSKRTTRHSLPLHSAHTPYLKLCGYSPSRACGNTGLARRCRGRPGQ